MLLLVSVCIAWLISWYCVLNVLYMCCLAWCVSWHEILFTIYSYKPTTPRAKMHWTLSFLGFWAVMRSECQEFFKRNPSIGGASMWVDFFSGGSSKRNANFWVSVYWSDIHGMSFLKEALSRINIFGFLRCGFGSFWDRRSMQNRSFWGWLYWIEALSWSDFSGEALSRIQILGFHPPLGI